MPRSWVCWWLLLGWALLLGQPGSGTEEGSSSAAEQEPGEVEEGPSDPDEVSSRSRDSKWRRWWKTKGKDMLKHLKHLATDHYNKQNLDSYYKEFKDMDMKLQNGNGMEISFNLFLAKTNCSHEDGMRTLLSAIDSTDISPAQSGKCTLLPESEQQKKKCTFTMFIETVTGGSSTTNHFCEPLIILQEDKPPEDSEEAASTNG